MRLITLATLALAAAAPIPQDCNAPHCPVYTRPVEPPPCPVAMRRADAGRPVWVCPTTTPGEALTTWVGWSTLPIPTWTYTPTTQATSTSTRSSMVYGPIPIPTRWHTLPVTLTLPITRSRITQTTTKSPSFVTGRPVTIVPVDPITLTAAPVRT